MLDCVGSVGTLPGALLQTLVARQLRAFIDQGRCYMARAVGPLPECKGRRPRAPVSPVVCREGTRTAVGSPGRCKLAARPGPARASGRTVPSHSGDTMAELGTLGSATTSAPAESHHVLDREAPSDQLPFALALAVSRTEQGKHVGLRPARAVLTPNFSLPHMDKSVS